MNAKELAGIGRLLNVALVAAQRLLKAAEELGLTPQPRKRRRAKVVPTPTGKSKPKVKLPTPTIDE